MDTPPDREAPASHPIEALLRRRWSPRSFIATPVAQAALESVLEAARWAASSENAQPWHYIVARRDADAAAFAALLGTLTPHNQDWAQHAGVLLLSVARTAFPTRASPNPHALHDTGAASAQMALQAVSLGLQLHQMAGFDRQKARAVFAIPEDFEPVAAIALGHVGPPEALPQVLAQRETAPRQRRPIGDFAFFGGWQELN